MAMSLTPFIIISLFLVSIINRFFVSYTSKLIATTLLNMVVILVFDYIYYQQICDTKAKRKNLGFFKMMTPSFIYMANFIVGGLLFYLMAGNPSSWYSLGLFNALFVYNVSSIPVNLMQQGILLDCRFTKT